MPVLRGPKDETELSSLHDLRERVLFTERGKNNYNRRHPSDLDPHNHFMGFWEGEKLLGTLRVDLLQDATAVILWLPFILIAADMALDAIC